MKVLFFKKGTVLEPSLVGWLHLSKAGLRRSVQKMAENKADLILHPVRMRLIQCLAGGQKMTTQQIKDHLEDVPQATLYRHLQKLEKAQIIKVVGQNQVRGTVEKIFALEEQDAVISTEELKDMTDDQHMELVTKFVSSMLGDFRRYLDQDKYDLREDGVSFRQVPIYLSDSEYEEMLTKLRKLYYDYIPNQPTPERKRRVFTTIILPDPKKNKT